MAFSEERIRTDPSRPSNQTEFQAVLGCPWRFNLKQVFIAQHPTEAHLVRGLLEASGIEAEVHGAGLFSVRGEAPATPDTLPSVWVLDDSEVARARVLLAKYGSREETRAHDSAAWTCAACGERVELQFTECWRCGAGRPRGVTDEEK
jgi:hypothetical protein